MASLLGRLKTFVEPPKKQTTKNPVDPANAVRPQQPKRKPQLPAQTPFMNTQAREIILEARQEALEIKRLAEEEASLIRGEILTTQARLSQKEEVLSQKLEEVAKKEEAMLQKNEEIEALRQKLVQELEKLSGLTTEEARKRILKEWEERLRPEIAKMIKEAESEAREEAEKRAREILVEAMTHGATDYVAEYTVSTVKIPDEEIKGRIIGKEGRNIKTLEQVTGVDFDIDETPGEIKLSSFDPVRREIAKVSLERLIADGRIQPGRIEEIVAKTKRDIERIMFSEGEKLAYVVGVYNLPREIIALLGRFKYRFSYGQNLIAHTLEETKIGVALANSVKADVNVVRLGCLLHDIGKVITDKEGTHVQLGVDILRRNGIPEKVIACVAEHHQDQPFSSSEAALVYIADAISGARPGARLEDLEQYVKRLTDLEEIAKKQEGVSDAYAFQAGRELRIIVDAEKVDDAGATILAEKVKDEIEKKLTVPGQVKISVIREFRAVELAA